MIKVATTVREIIAEDEIALTALQKNVLNANMYAQQILAQVSLRCLKKISAASVAAAIRRYRRQVTKFKPIKPEISITELSIKSPLMAIAYNKYDIDWKAILAKQNQYTATDYFVFSQGSHQVSFITTKRIIESLQKLLPAKYIYLEENLAALCVSISEKDYSEPNIIYALLSKIAIYQIDLVEIVTTYTEIVLIIRMKELDRAFDQLIKLVK
ncbi:MAG: hypothetical protein WCJ58_03235 [bacterium]